MAGKQRYPLHLLGWMFLLSETSGTPFNFVGGVTLREPVDPRRLEAALARVARELPPFAWRLERGHTDAWWRPGPWGPRLWPLARLGKRFDLAREAPVRVYAEGANLLGEASHAFCDGHGLLTYMNRVLAHYLDVEPPPLPDLDPRDPALRIVAAHPLEASAPRGIGLAPYRLRPQRRAARRWSLTYTLDHARLRRLAGRLRTTRRDLLLALYLLAVGEQRSRAGRALRLNVFAPENVRERYGVESLFNCCSALILPLELPPAAGLGETLAQIQSVRAVHDADATYLGSLHGLVEGVGGAAFQRAPLLVKRLGARIVAGAISDQIQTELVTHVGTGVAHPHVAPHLERMFAIPAVKHTRWCSFGYGGVGATYCCSFSLRSARPTIPAAFVRRLRALDPELVIGAPLRL